MESRPAWTVTQGWQKSTTVEVFVCILTPNGVIVSLYVSGSVYQTLNCCLYQSDPFIYRGNFPKYSLQLCIFILEQMSKLQLMWCFTVPQWLPSISPDDPCFFLGDFNLVIVRRLFTQYITCPTGVKKKALDLCYGSINLTYKSITGPPLGFSDHNVVHLLPSYRTVLHRDKAQTGEVQVWTQDRTLALQGCFDCMDWSVFLWTCHTPDISTTLASCFTKYHLQTSAADI